MTRTAKTDRAAIVAYIAAHTVYDPTTVRIEGDVVTAIKDADKTFNAPETVRESIGFVEDLLMEADRLA